MESIFYDTKIAIEALKAADNETLTGTGVDMSGFDAVAFVVGALSGEAQTFSIKAQQDSDAAFGTAQDLLGTAVSFAPTASVNGLATLDINKPMKRYVRPVITVPNMNAATPTFCISIRYKARKSPQSNTGEFWPSPAEGTA